MAERMRRIGVVCALACTFIVTVAAASAAVHVLAGQTYKPTRNWCATTENCFRRVRWRGYTSSRALGFATVYGCTGPGGTCATYRHVKLVLTAPRQVCGRERFTRLRFRGHTWQLSTLCDLLYYQF